MMSSRPFEFSPPAGAPAHAPSPPINIARFAVILPSRRASERANAERTNSIPALPHLSVRPPVCPSAQCCTPPQELQLPHRLHPAANYLSAHSS